MRQAELIDYLIKAVPVVLGAGASLAQWHTLGRAARVRARLKDDLEILEKYKTLTGEGPGSRILVDIESRVADDIRAIYGTPGGAWWKRFHRHDLGVGLLYLFAAIAILWEPPNLPNQPWEYVVGGLFLSIAVGWLWAAFLPRPADHSR